MRSYLKGFITAAILFSLAGFAVNLVADDDSMTYLEDSLNEFVNQNCDVQVGYGFTTAGRKCNFDRVMTGYDGNYIYCSDVTVRCSLK